MASIKTFTISSTVEDASPSGDCLSETSWRLLHLKNWSHGFRPISAVSGYGISDQSPTVPAEHGDLSVASAATNAFRHASALGGACPVVAMKETIDQSSCGFADEEERSVPGSLTTQLTSLSAQTFKEPLSTNSFACGE